MRSFCKSIQNQNLNCLIKYSISISLIIFMLSQQSENIQNQTTVRRDFISSEYFGLVPELDIIQQPFSISDIDHQLQTRDLQTQFELLRALTQTKQHKMRLRSNTVLQNKKNRYPQQSIYDYNRVLLNNSQQQTFEEGEELSQKSKYKKANYVNANFVYCTGQQKQNEEICIIGQAPLDETVKDFLSIIVQNQIGCVVMLCNVIENGKNRCSDYLNSEQFYEKVELLQDQEDCPSIQIRKVKVSARRFSQKPNCKAFYQFYHILFTAWPDKSVPSNPAEISPLLKFCLKHNRILIHCSAGLGRSGVIAVLYRILKSKEEKNISVFKRARELRQQRFGAIQNNQQYKFIYEYLKLWGNCKK